MPPDHDGSDADDDRVERLLGEAQVGHLFIEKWLRKEELVKREVVEREDTDEVGADEIFDPAAQLQREAGEECDAYSVGSDAGHFAR